MIRLFFCFFAFLLFSTPVYALTAGDSVFYLKGTNQGPYDGISSSDWGAVASQSYDVQTLGGLAVKNFQNAGATITYKGTSSVCTHSDCTAYWKTGQATSFLQYEVCWGGSSGCGQEYEFGVMPAVYSGANVSGDTAVFDHGSLVYSGSDKLGFDGVSLGGGSSSGGSSGSGADFTSLTSSVEFNTTIFAILFVFASLALVGVVLKGCNFVLSALGLPTYDFGFSSYDFKDGFTDDELYKSLSKNGKKYVLTYRSGRVEEFTRNKADAHFKFLADEYEKGGSYISYNFLKDRDGIVDDSRTFRMKKIK